MSENQIMQSEQEMWAVVELMGHGQTAGRITKPAEWGGLMRVDVPCDDEEKYTTEFYGMSAIYRVRFVSEEIARAYAPKDRIIEAYDTPIVTREQHQEVVRHLEDEQYSLRDQIRELERRLTSVNVLSSGEETDIEDVPF